MAYSTELNNVPQICSTFWPALYYHYIFFFFFHCIYLIFSPWIIRKKKDVTYSTNLYITLSQYSGWLFPPIIIVVTTIHFREEDPAEGHYIRS